MTTTNNALTVETLTQVKDYIEFSSDLDVTELNADQSVNFVMDLLNDTELENAIISMAYENSIPTSKFENFYDEVENYLNSITEENQETDTAMMDQIISKFATQG